MVAASNAASASRRRCRRSRSSVLAAVEQMRDHLVVTDRRRVVESRYRVDDLAANTVAQLLGRRPTERDQQHLVQRRHTLGDVAGHQTRQRERLAGARAGFQHRRRPRLGQRAQQVEGFDVRSCVQRSQHRQPEPRRRSRRDRRRIESWTATHPDRRRARWPSRRPRPDSGRWTATCTPPTVPGRRGCARPPPTRRTSWAAAAGLAAALVVHRHQIGQQVDGGSAGRAAVLARIVPRFLAGRCRPPTSRGSGS